MFKKIKLIAQSKLPTKFGDFVIKVYLDKKTKLEHFALIKGKINKKNDTLLRLHSECLTGEVLYSLKCDCKEQLDSALQKIEKEGNGILIYLRQEGRGIGLGNKINAYRLQEEQGLDTVEANEQLGFKADLREYKIAVDILKDLNINKIKLLTNNPDKIKGLKSGGINIVERIPLEIVKNKKVKKYLKTKKNKMGHLFDEI